VLMTFISLLGMLGVPRSEVLVLVSHSNLQSFYWMGGQTATK
jgi:hypothetical protein